MRRIVVVAAAALLVVAGAFALSRGSDDPAAVDPRAFCTDVARLSDLMAAAATGPKEIGEVGAARSLADDIATTAESLRRGAPEEIAEAAESLARVTAELAAELRDFYARIADDPSRANDPGFLASFQPLTAERRAAIEEAGAEVRPWIEEHCGTIRSGATGPTPAEGSDGTESQPPTTEAGPNDDER